jgi:putative ABC transport system permease protein
LGEVRLSLALSTLIYEWRRYMAAVLALALSGLLLMAMTGMFVGMGKAFTAVIDRSPADIMVISAQSENLNDNPGMPRRLKPSIYMHPEVVAVDERQTGWGRFQNQPGPDGKPKSSGVQVMTIDTVPGSVTIPTDFDDSVRIALEEPYAIAVDQSSLKGLGVKVGDLATFNGKTVKVAATIHGYPNLMQSMVVMSRETFRLLGMSASSDRVGPLMIKVRDPSRAAIVRDQLNAVSDGVYRAWLKPDLAKANETAMMGEQIIGIMLGFVMVLSIIIGIGITSQTLRGAILANIKEFASLRALGVSMRSLRRVVVELSFWVGVVGVSVAILLSMGVGLLASSMGVPMAFPPWLLMIVSGLLIAIALLSGMLSLGMLKKSQPADLLR